MGRVRCRCTVLRFGRVRIRRFVFGIFIGFCIFISGISVFVFIVVMRLVVFFIIVCRLFRIWFSIRKFRKLLKGCRFFRFRRWLRSFELFEGLYIDGGCGMWFSLEVCFIFGNSGFLGGCI